MFFDPRPRRGFRLSLQAGRPARLEDAFPRGALGRHAGKRRLAQQCPARQRLRAAACAAAIADCPGVELMFPVEANAVFLRAPPDRLEALRAARLALLHLHRRRRPLHVRLGCRPGPGGGSGPRPAGGRPRPGGLRAGRAVGRWARAPRPPTFRLVWASTSSPHWLGLSLLAMCGERRTGVDLRSHAEHRRERNRCGPRSP